MLNRILKKKILITGCAGFIGFHFSKFLLEKKFKVFGIDNLNNYYDVKLKKERIKILKKAKNFNFQILDLKQKKDVKKYFKKNNFYKIVHLAAQAGVRHSLLKPQDYIDNNISAYLNILEQIKHSKVQSLLYASTSSVYGANKQNFLSEDSNTDNPLQFYAVTKKTNELMSEAYSRLYNIKISGVRFFTIYGPWGRPDMALFRFTKNIIKKKVIEVNNMGKHRRNFTYIDDAINILFKILMHKQKKRHEIYNIANPASVKLTDYINLIEKKLGVKAKKKYLQLQKGDIDTVQSNISKIKKLFKYSKFVKVETGISNFIDWYKDYFKI